MRYVATREQYLSGRMFLTGDVADSSVALGDGWMLTDPNTPPSPARALGIPRETPVRIIGRTTLATLASGASSGTAGASTTATSLVKPSAAANWTSNDLVGKWLEVSSGGGSASTPVLRPIISNTTTTLSVHEVTGMDATTVFRIVDLEVIPAGPIGLELAGVRKAVEIYGLDFSADVTDALIALSDCLDVKVSGCKLDTNTVRASLTADHLEKLRVEHCTLSNSADISVTNCKKVEFHGIVATGGGVVSAADCVWVDVTKLRSTAAPSRVLNLQRVTFATGEVDASTGGATPIYLEDVAVFRAVGGLLTGSGNTGYGVEIANSGRYYLVGCTISGTDPAKDALIMGTEFDWAVLALEAYGGVEGPAGSVVVNPSGAKMQVVSNRIFLGDMDLAGRGLDYGYRNKSAPTTAVTLTGTDSYDMSTAARGALECVCNSASAQVLLPAGAAIAGVEVSIVNRGSATLTVKPPTGGTLNGGASTTIAAGASKTFMSLNGNGGKDFWVLT